MTPRRLNPNAIFLHWLIFLLFVTALSGIEYRYILPPGDPIKRSLRLVHIFTGQLIFLFSVLRMFIRFKFPVPPATHGSRWMGWSAMAVHGLLYVVMFTQPITGVLFMQAGDKEVAFLGWVLPKLITSDPVIHFTIKEIHQLVGNTFYVLALTHVAGALWHHFILKDDSLRGMLKGAPKKKTKD